MNQFAVSATAASGTAVRFGNINASYPAVFDTFSAQRLFIARNTHMMEITFFIPGTKIPATVSGFRPRFCRRRFINWWQSFAYQGIWANGSQLSAASAPVLNNGLSFVGISFNAGERVARVVIESGNTALSAASNDGANGVDVVAMDDLIYGEPRAAHSHSSDFDGDGATDFTVFRPSTGTWLTLNSGSNTFSALNFGQNGDMPIDWRL